ncbi:MAG: gamma-glutamyl-gamma-aminobutyrate hydrolase family protein [Eubacteriales bacterium]
MNRLNIALSVTIDNEVISVNRKYLDAIVAAGGIPTVLSPIIDDKYVSGIVDFFDGFMFCGGGDIDPAYYGEEKSDYLKNICLIRDRFEEKLFRYAFASGKPVLGICRGMQIINVFLGGTLYQHIEEHMQKEDRHTQTHAVSVIKDSLLYEIADKDSLFVNSFHHQAVKKLADCLTVDAVSEDGYIEAFHHEKHRFLLGLQWHPESYFEFDESAAKVFSAFINSCK